MIVKSLFFKLLIFGSGIPKATYIDVYFSQVFIKAKNTDAQKYLF